jgi:HEPN domain-containing protein
MDRQSRRRFSVRSHFVNRKKPFYAHICFLYQQSAEKYLKAFTLTQGLKFQKTHDLAALLQKCIEKAPAIESLADDCDLLATFYVETRYPVHWPATFTQDDAELADRAADRIRNFVRRELRLP